MLQPPGCGCCLQGWDNTELAVLFSPRLLGDPFISRNNSIQALISSAIKA